MPTTISHIARPWRRWNRRDSMLRAFVRKYAWVCVYHHPLRCGMSGRTECGKPSVTIAHRDIFTPTPALSRNPSIPILHTSRRLITVTLPRRNFFLQLRQCRGLPGERARTVAILLGVVCFLSLGKSLGYCQRNGGAVRKKAESWQSLQILRLLRLHTHTTRCYRVYFEDSLPNKTKNARFSTYFIAINLFTCINYVFIIRSMMKNKEFYLSKVFKFISRVIFLIFSQSFVIQKVLISWHI